MARKFTIKPVRRYDVKPPEKNRTNVILRLTCHAYRKTNNTRWANDI
jgi:hypothetical protein